MQESHALSEHSHLTHRASRVSSTSVRGASRYELAVALFLVLGIFSGLGQFLAVLGALPAGRFGLTLLFALSTIPIVVSRNTLRILPIHLWTYCYVPMSAIWIFRAENPGSALNGLVYSIDFAIILILAIELFRSQRIREFATRLILSVTIIAVLMNLYELMNPGIFSNVAGRSAGLHANPNTSAAALVVGLLTSYAMVKDRWRLFYCGFVGLGVFATFSRGGLLCWIVASTGIFILSSQRNPRTATIASIGLVSAIFIGIRTDNPLVQLFTSSIGGHKYPFIDRIAGTNWQTVADDPRIALIDSAWDKFTAQPLLGYGTGIPLLDTSGGVQGPHNIYLSFALQYGAIGLVLLIALGFIVLRNGTQVKSSANTWLLLGTLGLLGLFTHNLLNDEFVAVGLALAIGSDVFRDVNSNATRRQGS